MSLKVAITMATLMCAASVAAHFAKSGVRTVSTTPAIQLDAAIPRQFGAWREEPARAVQVVNPQTQAVLDKLYSQTLSRTYIDAKGYRVMLSLAYGDDQRGGLQAHKPEVCYPAQGFNLRANAPSQLSTPYGAVPVRRLDTQLGARLEPVTYWFAFGDQVVSGRFEQRIAELRLGLAGRVPHGLLFRVSSIDSDTQGAFREQDRFVNDLLVAMSAQDRGRVIGLASQASQL
jgi:EpsI family protein